MPDPQSESGAAGMKAVPAAVDEQDQERLRSSLGFTPVSPARQNLLSEMREAATTRSTRRRAARDAAAPFDEHVSDDDIGVRLDELHSAVEAIASRLGRGGRGESVPIMEQLRRLAASQSVLREDIQRLGSVPAVSGSGRPLSPAARLGGPGAPNAAAAPSRAEVRLAASESPAAALAALVDRVAGLEERMSERNELVETQLSVIGGQLSALQASVSGAFVAPDVDQLRGRLERLSAEVSGLRGELRSTWEHPPTA